MLLSESKVVQRACREFANDADEYEDICDHRPQLCLAHVRAFALCALRIGEFFCLQ